MTKAKRLAAAACGLAVMLAATSVAAHGTSRGALEIIHPWVSPTHDHATHAHPTIANNGEEPIVLEGIRTDVAESAAFLVGGWEVTEIVIPGGDVLAPDQFRVALTGLVKPLGEGDHFEAVLKVRGLDDLVFHMVVGENTEMPMMENGAMIMDLGESDSEMPAMDHGGMMGGPQSPE